jgi:hypothetical protein
MYLLITGKLNGEATNLFAKVGDAFPANFVATKIVAANETIVGLATDVAAITG